MAGINKNQNNNQNNQNQGGQNQNNNNNQQNNQNNNNNQQQQQNNGGFSQDSNGKTYSEDELRALLEAGKVSAKSDFLSSLGLSDENELKGIISQFNEDNEKNKTELEKAVLETEKVKKQLFAEQELRKLAETKILSLKLGAKPDTVDDLVVLAKSKLGDVEFKEDNLGKVLGELKEVYPFYFVDGDNSGNNGDDMSGKGTSGNLRGKMDGNNSGGSNHNSEKNNNNGNHGGQGSNNGGEKSLAERLIANRKKKGKSNYFSKY